MSRVVLGLDIGESSIGGALLRLNDEEELEEILWANSRVFSGVVDSQNGVTRNAQRRNFRGQRRTIDRRARRRRRVENALVEIGLLPSDEAERAKILGRNSPSQNPFLNPYQLRARAIAERLEPFEIGRALQHILQRRGFRSNRKAKLADLLGPKSEFRHDEELQAWIAQTQESVDVEDEDKKVKSFTSQHLREAEETSLELAEDGDEEDPARTLQAIEALEKRWKKSGLPTIGTFLASELAAGNKVRKRNRLLRTWLEEEFDRIWEFQSQFHPTLLTAEAKEILRSAFEQRPLKPFRAKLPKRGWAEGQEEYFARMTRACGLLGPGKPVARKGHWVSHRYRILETLRNLRLRTSDGDQPLTREQYLFLAEKMQRTEKMTWAQIRKEIKAPPGSKFTIETSKGSPQHLQGNSTEIKLKRILGDKWDDSLDIAPDVRNDQLEFMQDLETMNDVRRPAVVKLFKLLQRPKRKGNRIYPLSKRQAFELLCESFSSQTVNDSVRAMRMLHKRMLGGEKPHEARQAEQKQKLAAGGCKLLPPPPPLRNPRVHRALCEVRRVINALIEKHGLPDLIRIELATELRENKKERKAHSDAIKENERKNREAAEWFAKQPAWKGREPTKGDMRKHRLWTQQSGICPYCLSEIGATEILEDIAEIDHVVPITRSGMDSFSNKVLAHRACNAAKGDRLPAEVWQQGTPEWTERVKFIKRIGNRALLTNFQRLEVPEDFVERQLADTRYITKECVRYLDQLELKGIPWGSKPWPENVLVPPGVHLVDGLPRLTVWPTNGSATGFLRRVWELNDILPMVETRSKVSEAEKNRLDHRHHALDAIVVGLTTPKRYKAALEAYRGPKEGRERAQRQFYKPPKNKIKCVIGAALTSHAVNKGIRGALHDALFYGRKEIDGEAFYVRRVGIESLYRPNARRPDRETTKSYIAERVYDKDLRCALLRRLDQGDWDTAFKRDPATGSLPRLTDARGNIMFVETVRVKHPKRSDDSTINIDNPGSKSPTDRYVAPESNHHAEIIRLPNGKLTHRVVRMMDAARAMRSKRSPYGLAVRPGEKLEMCLAMDEIVEYDGQPMRVASVAMDGVFLRGVNDTRSSNDMDNCVVKGDNKLSLLGSKLVADPLGNLSVAHGP